MEEQIKVIDGLLTMLKKRFCAFKKQLVKPVLDHGDHDVNEFAYLYTEKNLLGSVTETGKCLYQKLITLNRDYNNWNGVPRTKNGMWLYTLMSTIQDIPDSIRLSDIDESTIEQTGRVIDKCHITSARELYAISMRACVCMLNGENRDSIMIAAAFFINALDRFILELKNEEGSE